MLLLNYAMNPANSIFGHQFEIVIKISESFESVTIITTEYLGNELPENVKVYLAPWKSSSKILSVVKFYLTLILVLMKKRYDLVFSHMVDTQAFLAVPFLKILRIPHIFWYAHANPAKRANLVSHLSNFNISSTKGSFPLSGRPVKFLGQSINLQNYKYHAKLFNSRNHLVHIGRLDSSKNILLLIELASKVHKENENVRLDLWGRLPVNEYLEKLKWELEKSKSFIKYNGQTSRENIPNVLVKYNIFVHAFYGSLDKSILEATAIGLPVVTLNQEYINEFGCWSKLENTGDLAFLIAEINSLLQSPDFEIDMELKRRREIVENKHSLDNWMSGFLSLCNTLLNEEKSTK